MVTAWAPPRSCTYIRTDLGKALMRIASKTRLAFQKTSYDDGDVIVTATLIS